jgi:membrane associated rhomboid family serine protease
MLTHQDVEIAALAGFVIGVIYGFAVDWALARNRAKQQRGH